MSFLKGFADAYDEDRKSKRDAKQTREAYMFQTDYRMSQENNLNKKKREQTHVDLMKKVKAFNSANNITDPSQMKLIQDSLIAGTSVAALQERVDTMDMTTVGNNPREKNLQIAQETKEALLGQVPDIGPSALRRQELNKDQTAAIDAVSSTAGVIAKDTGATPEDVMIAFGGSSDASPILKSVFTVRSDSQKDRFEGLGKTQKALEIQLAGAIADGNIENALFYQKVITEFTNAPDLEAGEGWQFVLKDNKRIMTPSKWDGQGNIWLGAGKDKDGNQLYQKESVNRGLTSGMSISSENNLSKDDQDRLWKRTDPYIKRRSALNSLISNNAEAIRLNNESGGAALTAVQGGLVNIAAFKANLETIGSVVGGLFSDEATNMWDVQSSDAMKQLEESGAFENNDAARKIMQLRFITAYNFLKSNSRDGKMAQAEINRAVDNVFTKDPEALSSFLSASSVRAVADLESQRQTLIRENPRLIGGSDYKAWIGQSVSEFMQASTINDGSQKYYDRTHMFELMNLSEKPTQKTLDRVNGTSSDGGDDKEVISEGHPFYGIPVEGLTYAKEGPRDSKTKYLFRDYALVETNDKEQAQKAMVLIFNNFSTEDELNNNYAEIKANEEEFIFEGKTYEWINGKTYEKAAK